MLPVSRPFFGKEEVTKISEVLDSRWLGLGATVKEFEDKASTFLNAPRFLAINTGTTALHLALRASGIGNGDEVIVPSLTFVAGPQAIVAAGAKPVFCDVDKNTLNIDITDVEKLITPQTKAIMPVHYRGLACDMDGLLAIANKHKLVIIEDAAHAFGSKYKGKPIGSFGHVTCFSFDPIKNVTCGEGGGIVFQDAGAHELAVKMRILGIDKDTWARYQNKRSWFYDVTNEGYRYHMPNFCAAIGVVQLARFQEMNSKRVAICKRYDNELKTLKRIKLFPMNYDETAPFMYIVYADDRNNFMEFMSSKGIGTGVHYIPSHTFSFFNKCRKSELTATEWLAEGITTIPLYYEMQDNDLDKIISSIKEYDAGK
jgi:dTDP-4-amino-4,6-dideoxygalactose transaminase